MSDYLVLVGSVNSQQYQTPRLELLRRGCKPKIKRVTDEEVAPPFLEFGSAKTHLEYLKDSLGIRLSEIRGLIMNEPVWINDENLLSIYEDLLPDDLWRWVIRPNGEVEFAD